MRSFLAFSVLFTSVCGAAVDIQKRGCDYTTWQALTGKWNELCSNFPPPSAQCPTVQPVQGDCTVGGYTVSVCYTPASYGAGPANPAAASDCTTIKCHAQTTMDQGWGTPTNPSACGYTVPDYGDTQNLVAIPAASFDLSKCNTTVTITAASGAVVTAIVADKAGGGVPVPNGLDVSYHAVDEMLGEGCSLLGGYVWVDWQYTS